MSKLQNVWMHILSFTQRLLSRSGCSFDLLFVLTIILCSIVNYTTAAHADSTNNAHVDLVDVITLDQNGRSLRFASEAVGDRIVVVNFIYTTCKTLCPVSSALFAQLQESLYKKNEADDIRLISITLDPVYDTPKRLKILAQQYDARNNWLWLTGDEINIDAVIRGLGATADNFRQHDSFFLVGDARTKKWTIYNVLPDPERLLTDTESLLSKRNRTSGKQ